MALATIATAGDRNAIAQAVEEASRAALFLVAVPLLGFCWIILPMLAAYFGGQWGGLEQVFPFFACSSLLFAMAAPQTAWLAVEQRDGTLLRLHAVYLTALMSLTAVLLPLVGLTGALIADVSASVLYILYLQLAVCPRAQLSWLWCAAGMIALFLKLVGPLVILAPILVLLLPLSRQQVLDWLTLLRQRVEAHA
jgi:O-antigen/teichoic acid export membrane protein